MIRSTKMPGSLAKTALPSLSVPIIATVALLSLAAFSHGADDYRNIRMGLTIPSENYADQPYAVVTPEGHWVVTLTTGPGAEGSTSQHIVSTVSTDKGQTWSPLSDIEPSSGPEASWAVPLITPSGRIYAFYTYNDVGVTGIRADILGSYMYKYSDNNGQTWSAERYELPMRVTECDHDNGLSGDVQLFWGVDKPKISGGEVHFAFTKIGQYFLDQSEGWMFHSDNIMTETDPNLINWEMLPVGEYGIRSPNLGSIQAEHCHVPLSGDDKYVIYRTTTGSPAHSYSRDGGQTWSEPVTATYTPGGRRIKQPRANIKAWKAENGKYLLWFHNNGHTDFNGRNPAWLCGGTEIDGQIHWSQPEIILYDPTPDTRFSYPDMIEQDGRYWITETNKTIARVHEIDSDLIDALWTQGQVDEVTQDGLGLSWNVQSGGSLDMPTLPSLADNGGFALDFWIELDDISVGQIIADSRNAQGKGVVVRTGTSASIEISLNDGSHSFSWTSDPGTIMCDRTHHVAAIVDGGPNIVTFVVDGQVNDGGYSRTYGWGRFDSAFSDCNGSATLSLAPSLAGELSEFRFYDRYLLNSEMVANYWANDPPPYVPPELETSLSYDGSHDPYNPPGGEILWLKQGALLDPILLVPPEGPVAQILDNGTSLGQRIQISHPLVGVDDKEWAYEVRLNVLSGTDSSYGIFGIGVRDECGLGRSAWINWFDDGLYLLDNSASKNAASIKITDENCRGDGYHVYRVVKFWEDGEFKLQVFIDYEPQFDTPLSYSQLPLDETGDRGFGLFTSSPSTSNSYLDYMRFGTLADIIGLPGDANFDGIVNDADVALLAANWQTMGGATWVMGDFNGDGNIDDQDATLLAVNWMQTVASASVPEPGLMPGLLGLALALLCSRNLKRRRVK